MVSVKHLESSRTARTEDHCQGQGNPYAEAKLDKGQNQLQDLVPPPGKLFGTFKGIVWETQDFIRALTITPCGRNSACCPQTLETSVTSPFYRWGH